MSSKIRWTRTRLVVPILSDIDVERRAAVAAGRPWRARWIVMQGYVGLIRALALPSGGVASREMGPFAAMFLFLTVVLALPPLRGLGFSLWLYAVPQAIPLSIPLAAAFAIGWQYRRGNRVQSSRRVLALGLIGSSLALATMQWLVPDANQAFRVAAFHRIQPGVTLSVPRGVNELSLVEMARFLRTPSSSFGAAVLEFELHVRIAVGLSTGMFALLAVALRRGRTGAFPARTFIALVLAYSFAFTFLARSPAGGPLLVWVPNACVGALSLLLLFKRSSTGSV